MKRAPQIKKTPVPLKAKTTAKALKVKKAVFIHSIKNKIFRLSTFWRSKILTALEAPTSRKSTPRRNIYTIIKFPLTNMSVKKTEGSNMLVFMMDVKVNKYQIRSNKL